MEEYDNHRYKLVVIGSAGVGKSSLIKQFTTNKFNERYIPTIGVDLFSKKIIINEQRIEITMWDTAGQERFRALVPANLRKAQGYILVYDINNQASFSDIESIWMKMIDSHGEKDAELLLIGAKSDSEEFIVNQNIAREYAKENNMLHFQISSKTSEALNDAVIALAENIMKKRSARLNKANACQKTELAESADLLGKPPKKKIKIEEVDYTSKPLLKNGDLLHDAYLKSIYEENEFKLVGEGIFGKVFCTTRKESGEKIAIKVIETDSKSAHANFLEELLSSSKTGDHPNIITYSKLLTNEVLENGSLVHQILLEMPLLTNNLENIIQLNSYLPEDDVINIVKQISSGLKFAHDRKIAHLDLKPQNILFKQNTCIISDWAGTLPLKFFPAKALKFKIACNRGYSAPEIEDYGNKSSCDNALCDIYSLGILILRMCGISEDQLAKIPKGVRKYHDLYLKEDLFTNSKEFYSEKLKALIFQMTAFEPKERIPLENILSYFH